MMILIELFLNFFKIGMFTIGGGMAIIPLIADLVVTKGWINSQLLYDFIAVSESTPGPFAINVATYVGFQMSGFIGALVAVLGVFLPSFLIILLVFKLSSKMVNNVIVKDAFAVLRPAVVGLIASAVFVIGFNSFFNNVTIPRVGKINYIGLIVTAGLFLLYFKCKKIHPIVFIILSAGVGMLVYSFL